MTRRRRVLLAALAAVALLLAGCASDEGTVVLATFDDVVDLTTRGAVKVADVTVGSVRTIELAPDNRALVTLAVDPDVALPSRVTARLRKTNVLGERFVELVPDPDSGGSFTSGTMVQESVVVPELEELVFAGTDLIAAVAADRLAVAIEAGAEGLGGRGGTLNVLLDDLSEIVTAYSTNSDDTVRLIEGFEGFLADVGPQADLHGQALAELLRFNQVLAAEDERLLDTLSDVRALALSGTDIMVTHRQRLDAFFTRITRLSDEIVSRDEDLSRLFFELQRHNMSTIAGVNSEHAQIILDFIVCGINDEPGDPVRSCEDQAPGGMQPPEPRPPQDLSP
ncbi:MAG: MlaD family protein [Egibacteraceae bacterium]